MTITSVIFWRAFRRRRRRRGEWRHGRHFDAQRLGKRQQQRRRSAAAFRYQQKEPEQRGFIVAGPEKSRSAALGR